MRKKYSLILIFLPLVLSACFREKSVFEPGDMRKDFCGTHLNYQYCDCAFEGKFCAEVAQNQDEAKAYVEAEYGKWVQKESMAFAERCRKENGQMKKDKCVYCPETKVLRDGKCVRSTESESETAVSDTAKECVADDDCAAVCKGNLLSTMICDQEKGRCAPGPDKDCALDTRSYGETSFPMICQDGRCQDDIVLINAKKAELENELSELQTQISAGATEPEPASLLATQLCARSGQDYAIADLSALAIAIASSSSAYRDELAVFLDAGSAEVLAALLDHENRGWPSSGAFATLACLISEHFQPLERAGGADDQQVRIKALEAEIAAYPKE